MPTPFSLSLSVCVCVCVCVLYWIYADTSANSVEVSSSILSTWNIFPPPSLANASRCSSSSSRPACQPSNLSSARPWGCAQQPAMPRTACVRPLEASGHRLVEAAASSAGGWSWSIPTGQQRIPARITSSLVVRATRKMGRRGLSRRMISLWPIRLWNGKCQYKVVMAG